MKRYLLMMAALIIVSTAYGQKKPKINKAEVLWKAGIYGEAKAIVDAGINHEKTMNAGKTWYIRALVYASLDTTTNVDYQGLADDPLGTAMEAFAKSDELAGDKGYYTYMPNSTIPVTQVQQVNDYWAYYFNKAALAYGDEEYQTAYDFFISAQRVLPSDSNAYINAGLAAQSLKQYDKAANQYKIAVAKGSTSTDTYGLWIYVLSQQEKYEEALAVSQEVRKLYPDDTEMIKTEVNLFIKLEKIEEAKDGLMSAIKAEPENANLHFTLGVLYEELSDTESALKSYRTAIEVDPEHYNSYFNIGVLMINEATIIIKERNALGITKAEIRKAKEFDGQIKEKLTSALPTWERLYELKPKDEITLETLQYVYNQLKMYDKSEQMYNELEALGPRDDG